MEIPGGNPAVEPPSRPSVLIDRCICRNLSFAELLPLARSGAWSLAELIRNTGCGGQCGLCRPYLRRMLGTGETTFDHLLPPDTE